MSNNLSVEVLTRHGPTVHEDISEQFHRLSGKLWQQYDAELRASEEVTYEQTLGFVVIHPDDGRFSKLQIDRGACCHDIFVAPRHSGVEVLIKEPIERGPKFRSFQQYLNARINILVITNVTRASSETSSLISSVLALHPRAKPHLEERQPSHETKWTDEKNRRRCELVDKDIEGTLSEGEQGELEKLQIEMLAYRRSVAPLPLEDLRDLHQELLHRAASRSRGNT